MELNLLLVFLIFLIPISIIILADNHIEIFKEEED